MEKTMLEFEYKGKEYTLAYNINVVKNLDKMGTLSALVNGQRPITITQELFAAAFEANHSAVPNRTREEIFLEFSDTSVDGSLLDCLVEMINEVREAMSPKGNVQWRMAKK